MSDVNIYELREELDRAYDYAENACSEADSAENLASDASSSASSALSIISDVRDKLDSIIGYDTFLARRTAGQVSKLVDLLAMYNEYLVSIIEGDAKADNRYTDLVSIIDYVLMRDNSGDYTWSNNYKMEYGWNESLGRAEWKVVANVESK